MRGGTYTVGADGGTLRVHTRRQGAAARAGHDLVLEATKWSATFTVDDAAPQTSHLEAAIDAASLVVREASGGALPITAGQREEIVHTIRAKVLHSDRHPEIRVVSTAVTVRGTGADVAIDLTIAGRTQPATLAVHVVDSAEGPVVTGTATVRQTDFGITPYSALFGALKVRDEVEISVEVRLPPD